MMFILGMMVGGLIAIIIYACVIVGSDAVEPKHGHWDNKIIDARFDVPHTVARCSNCKGKIWVYAENYVVKYPYCPLCGANMDEVEE